MRRRVGKWKRSFASFRWSRGGSRGREQGTAPAVCGDRGGGREWIVYGRIAAAPGLDGRGVVARSGDLSGCGQEKRPTDVDLRREVVAQRRGRGQGAAGIFQQDDGGDRAGGGRAGQVRGGRAGRVDLHRADRGEG